MGLFGMNISFGNAWLGEVCDDRFVIRLVKSQRDTFLLSVPLRGQHDLFPKYLDTVCIRFLDWVTNSAHDKLSVSMKSLDLK